MKSIHLTNISTGEILQLVLMRNGAHESQSSEAKMKIILDAPRCEGHGLCEEVAPKLMHLDDDGELILDVVDVDDSNIEAAKAAVRVCPVAALKLQ
jgi:ferredoxin